MRRTSILVVLFSLTCVSGFCADDTTFSDLEAELLSLEQELLDPPTLESQTSIVESSSLLATPPEEPLIVVDIPPSYPPHQTTYPHEEKSEVTATHITQISLQQVFSSSPFIYSILLSMSFIAITLCLYVILRLKEQNKECNQFAEQVRAKFLADSPEEVRKLCEKHNNWLSKMVSSGLSSKKHGIQATLESMHAEGKRATLSAWQQLGILQDIAIIAPMLGLLGTVIGLFYAFYDLNRSLNSLSHLLDGLGISVGTTVAGICVAIISMILHSIAKFRLIRSLAKIEVEACAFAYLMEEHLEHKD